MCACVLLSGALILIAATAQADGVLYFADIFYPDWSDGYVYSVSVDGTGLQTVVDVGGGLRGIATDQYGGKLYWTDVDNDVIRRADLDGGNPEDLITSGLAWPMAIGVHPAADMLCWGDMTLDQIGTAHLDGSSAGPLLSTSFHSGIAFDTMNGKIYWSTSITSTEGEILRADLDGSNVETVVTGANKPGPIALDIAGGKIYWTDYTVDMVRRADLDGSEVENLYVVGPNLNPDGIALDLDTGKVYWGQAHAINRGKIMRMNLDGTYPEDVLTGDFGIITHMALVPSSTGVEEGIEPASMAFRLEANAPNPFNPATTIRFAVPEAGRVLLEVYDVRGRLVAVLADGSREPGESAVTWRGTDDQGDMLPSGVYFARLRAGGEVLTRKITLVR
jgi:sugar lactone lactonase YvrE